VPLRIAQTWLLVANLAALEDHTVAIVGYGGIGRGIAQRLQSSVAQLICFSRRQAEDEIAGTIHSLDALPRCGAVMLALALSDSPRHLFDVSPTFTATTFRGRSPDCRSSTWSRRRQRLQP
jgi:lactate dehydrogenase-like 2-hydroxyacid dehydrogenase